MTISQLGRCLLLIAMCIPALHAPAAAQEPRRVRPAGRAYLLTGATIIDGRGGPPIEGQAVFVWNGVIQDVGSPNLMELTEGFTVLDLDGYWLVPGYIDAYAHARDSLSLRRLLAAGITTVRSPTPARSDGLDLKRLARSRDITSPRIFTSGPIIDSPPEKWPRSRLVQSEEEIRTAVEEQLDADADFVSLSIGLTPDLVKAAVEAAHDADRQVVGDLVATSWIEAGRMGIDGLANVVSRNPALLPEEARDSYRADVQSGRAHSYYRWLELLDLGSPEMDRVLTALLSTDVSVQPTLASVEAVLFCGNETYEDRVATYYPDGARAPQAANCPSTTGPPDFAQRAEAAWPRALELVEFLHEEGVRLLAGSNAPYGAIPAGDSFHRELELLVQAGLSEREVLKIATQNAASALGILHETGTIEPEKRADLVLLRGDPISDIRQTRNIEWVMMDGRVYAGSGSAVAGGR